MTDDLAASKIDLRFLMTLGVVFAGVVAGWTINREAVRENAKDVARLSTTIDAALAEMGQLGNRVLTLETAMSYRADEINRKIDRLMQLQGLEPDGDRR